jgi:hypothetical protein
MSTTEYIRKKLNTLANGYVFTYVDFLNNETSSDAVIKALNRLVQKGSISKISKGKFYKKEETPFGALEPTLEQSIKDLLVQGRKPIAYLTGLSTYNSLGLTTQISNTVQIAKNDIRPSFNRGKYKISYIKQQNTITQDNIPLLQLLDALRYIKKIPDTSILDSFKQLKYLINELSEQNQTTLVRLALKYSPATRALLGTLLQESDSIVNLNKLKNSLNTISIYKFPTLASHFPSAQNWNIK